jgi:hypothetical protein
MSLDHLFVDQDSIPTLIEVKRASDTRIRCEVVGQMLDYAANAVAYWPVETLQSALERRCRNEGLELESVLAAFLGQDVDEAGFWQKVKTNLQAGRVRLLFVADEIPAELRRIVEFLNQQMDPAEVLAVEVRQFVGDGLRTIVPRVFGQTEQAREKKAAGPRTTFQWSEESWFAKVAERGAPEDSRVARAIYDWARERGLRLEWGASARDGSFRPKLELPDGLFLPLVVYHGYRHPYVELQIEGFNRPPLSTPTGRAEYIRRMNAVQGLKLSADAKWPSVRLADLRNPQVLHQFLDVLDWSINCVRVEAGHSV